MFRRRHIFTEIAWLLVAVALTAASGIAQASARPSADAGPQLHTIERLLGSGHRRRALAQMDALRGSGDLTPQETFALAWMYGRVERSGIALAMFQSLPADVPDARSHAYAIALCQFNLGKYAGAIQTLQQMQARGIADRESVHLLAVAYDQAGQPAQAYAVLRADLLRHPKDLNGYLNLIALCVNHRNNQLAAKVASRGLEELPGSYQLYSSRAAVLSLDGKQPQAVADYRAAIRLQPRRPGDYFSLALIQYHQGNYAAAMQTLGQAIHGGFADSDIHYLLAECMRAQRGPTAAALQEVTQAVRMDPQSAPALALRGQIELLQGNTAAAIRELEKARVFAPASKQVEYNLARAYQKAGRKPEAQALFQHIQKQSQDLNSSLEHKKLIQILVERPAHP